MNNAPQTSTAEENANDANNEIKKQANKLVNDSYFISKLLSNPKVNDQIRIVIDESVNAALSSSQSANFSDMINKQCDISFKQKLAQDATVTSMINDSIKRTICNNTTVNEDIQNNLKSKILNILEKYIDELNENNMKEIILKLTSKMTKFNIPQYFKDKKKVEEKVQPQSGGSKFRKTKKNKKQIYNI